MNAFVTVLNAFIEDTCVIIVIAYLLTRGRMLALLTAQSLSSPEVALLGVVLGLIALTEAVFPGARFPYVAHTLIVTFAAYNRGPRVGAVTAVTVIVGAALFQPLPSLLATGAAVMVSAAVGAAAHSISPRSRQTIAAALLAGAAAQAAALLARETLANVLSARIPISHALVSVPANAVGVMLLQLVLGDALVRARSERHRLEAEHARALVAEAELTALRARVHPHFLYNALTSIAALCGIDPAKAEAAVIRLGQLMRRSLETDMQRLVRLSEEAGEVQGYLEIEQYRFGPRLGVRLDLDPGCSDLAVPSFSYQTLVENAIVHGLGPKTGECSVTIVSRRYARHALIAVCDDGVGMSLESRHSALEPSGSRVHGLPILSQQLVLAYGRLSRLRIRTSPGKGTIAAFVVPLHTHGRLSQR